MRADVVSIFPAYLDALDLSLPGKARRSGFRVANLQRLQCQDPRRRPCRIVATDGE